MLTQPAPLRKKKDLLLQIQLQESHGLWEVRQAQVLIRQLRQRWSQLHESPQLQRRSKPQQLPQ